MAGQKVIPAPVAPQSILCDSAKAVNTVTPAAFLTVPAGRQWIGSINVVCDNTAATAVDATATVNTSGTGVTPAAGVALATAVDSGATGTGMPGQVNNVTIQAPVGNSVNLTLTNSTATTFSSYASATGILVDPLGS